MRVTVSHNKSQDDVIRAIDRSFDDIFRSAGAIPLQIVDEHRQWNGSTMNFSFTAKFGFVSTPIKGFVEVADKDLTIDVDLGLLEKLFPAKEARTAVESKVRGLLQ